MAPLHDCSRVGLLNWPATLPVLPLPLPLPPNCDAINVLRRKLRRCSRSSLLRRSRRALPTCTDDVAVVGVAGLLNV